MTLVIGLVGKSGSGKGTVAQIIQDALKNHLDISSVRISDPINEALEAWGLEKDRPNQQKISTLMREAFGQDLIANAIEKRIRKLCQSNGVVMVDGMRRPADVSLIRQFNDPNHSNTIIGITVPAQVRFARIKKRADRPGDAEKTWRQFLEEQRAETEQLIDGLVRQADFVIDNSGDVDHLRRKVIKLLQRLGYSVL